MITDSSTSTADGGARRRRIRRTLALFLALSCFMYASIAYKIINFGP